MIYRYLNISAMQSADVTMCPLHKRAGSGARRYTSSAPQTGVITARLTDAWSQGERQTDTQTYTRTDSWKYPL